MHIGADSTGGSGAVAAGGASMTAIRCCRRCSWPPWRPCFSPREAVALRRWRASGRSRAALWRWIGVTLGGTVARRLGNSCRDHGRRRIRHSERRRPRTERVPAHRPLTGHGGPDLEGRTRMELAHNDIQALIDRYPQARFAVIGFASGPSLEWPLSADSWSLRPVMDTVTPYTYGSDAVTQTNAGAANTVLRYQLISAVQQYPRARTWSSTSVPALRVKASSKGIRAAGRVRSTAVLCSATAPRRGVPFPAPTSNGPPSTMPRCERSPTSWPCPMSRAPMTRHWRRRCLTAASRASRRDSVGTAGGQTETYWAACPGRSDPHPDRALLRAARLPPQQARGRGHGAVSALRWWRGGPARLRLRRRLLVFSTPVALLLVVVIVKVLSVVIAGDSAVSAYTERDNGGLRTAVGSLTVLNVVEPEKAYFAAGALAVLDNRIQAADRRFSESLARTSLPSPARSASTSNSCGRHWGTARPPPSILGPQSPSTSVRGPSSNRPRRAASPATVIWIRSGGCCATTPCPDSS